MQYENYETDPPFNPDQGYGFFGFPGAMLESAINSDNVKRFEFYRSRYFGDNPRCLGSDNLIAHVKARGAERILKHLQNL